MGFADRYLDKQRTEFTAHPDLRTGNPGCLIIIPCYNEDNLTGTLDSLWQCERPALTAGVIVIINSASTSTPEIRNQNRKTLEEFRKWISVHKDPSFPFQAIYVPDLPAKHAGAGLARKIGMDLAVHYFNRSDNPGGIIVSLDADCTVDGNYLAAIADSMAAGTQAMCATIYFEHPVKGTGFPPEVYRAVIEYELHLRYHIEYLRHIGFPNARHTIGSCFAVSALAYVKQGGMNMHRAGEDFYFLNKMFPAVKTIEINHTRVMPSPRPSLRVPFGTGPEIRKYTETANAFIKTFNPIAYDDLRELIRLVPQVYPCRDKELTTAIQDLPVCLKEFLLKNNVVEKIHEIKRNTATAESFIKRFYGWFNAFMTVKFLNHSHRSGYSHIPVIEAVRSLLDTMNLHPGNTGNPLKLLERLRGIQRKRQYVSPL